MDQVSSSRGVGLIVGPAIGGYLAQVTIYCHLHRKLIFALVQTCYDITVLPLLTINLNLYKPV